MDLKKDLGDVPRVFYYGNRRDFGREHQWKESDVFGIWSFFQVETRGASKSMRNRHCHLEIAYQLMWILDSVNCHSFILCPALFNFTSGSYVNCYYL